MSDLTNCFVWSCYSDHTSTSTSTSTPPTLESTIPQQQSKCALKVPTFQSSNLRTACQIYKAGLLSLREVHVGLGMLLLSSFVALDQSVSNQFNSSEIARALVIHKCRVIMVNVHEKQSTEAVSKICKEVGADAALEYRYCDMTDLIQVQEVFSALCNEILRLDICIFGVGIDPEHFATDLHCIDAYFGMMWLGHFYASNLLWPLLRRTSRIPNTPAPRVIFEAPGQQRLQSLSSDSSSSDEEDPRRTAYNAEVCSEIFRRSKTSLLLGVRHGLAERIVKRHHDNIYVLAVQPAKSAVDVGAQSRRDSHWQPTDLCDSVLDTLAKDTEFAVRSSSRITLYAATSSDVEDKYLNGAYLVDVVSYPLLALVTTPTNMTI
jgi:hypothetical protein